ncbi:hypothetical protein LTR84_009303 [Exophiala bonariae]|uniref:Uncharacterized protein n=1 Tax=Exophiala bonariae TaxID=1690606 RepID=A0AAV9MUZ3_9EURO|nr:hypothetical protein LTR84_009303 [Exophiala bonariae]
MLPQETSTRLTLTAKGMKFLAERGIIPDIPREDIEDKSKADALAKILCALGMYAMWWNKPLLAKEPILVKSEAITGLLPFMYMSSEVSGRVDPEQMQSQTIVKTLFAYLNLYSKVPEIEYVCCRQTRGEIPASTVPASNGLDSSKMIVSQIKGQDCQRIGPECQELRAFSMGLENTTAFFERRPRVRIATEKYFASNDTADIRIARLSEMLKIEDPITLQNFSHKIAVNTTCIHFKPEQLLVKYSHNWPSDELLRSVDGLVVGMVLWLANFLYGSLHAAAWNDHFPSMLEKWLWRSSAIYIAFCGGLWVILNYMVKSYKRLNEFWEKWMDGEKSWLQNVTLGTIVVICGFSLMFARAYIVVEAFLSIRQLPASAYETPSWSQIFPHF